MQRISINTINRFLRGEAATLVLLAMALIAQTPHTATVFHRLAPATGDPWASFAAWTHAAAYAIALEFATLVFVVRGQTRLAWVFAGASVLVNAAYYYAPGIGWGDGLRAALICLALPACIAFYSHSVADAEQDARLDDAQPEPTPVHTETADDAQPDAPAQSDDAQPPTADRAQIARQMKDEGFTIAQIAAHFDVHRNTVSDWLKKTNGHHAEATQ